MALYRFLDHEPQLADTAWVAESAQVIGQVHLGEQASVWFNATLRADNGAMVVGDRSNIQDGSVLHSDPGFPLNIGQDVTVGHQVMLHGCSVGDGSLIGIQSVVLNGAVIGKHCLVGAGSVVTEGKVFPDGSLIFGAPAKLVKALTPEQIEGLKRSAASYVQKSALFRQGLQRVDNQ
jgi:carbonic anhydrase/acetyltransferase-like protein (isoleucine patch superfamily)